jgi:hypothetical protein
MVGLCAKQWNALIGLLVGASLVKSRFLVAIEIAVGMLEAQTIVDACM